MFSSSSLSRPVANLCLFFPIRLYQPPVESDLQSKPKADIAAHARSTIRRGTRTRLVRNATDQMRERRRRVHATADAIAANPSSEYGSRARRDAASHMAAPYDRIVTMFGEQWAHLHAAESNPSPLRDEHNSDLPAMAVEPEFLSRNRAPSVEPYLSRSAQAPHHPVRASQTQFRFQPRAILTPHSPAAQRDPLGAFTVPAG